MIKLNVQGKIFETTYDTITKIPYFKNMFEDVNQKSIEPIFIDRSPQLFKHILAIATDSFYPYPAQYAFELDYFLIDKSTVNLFYDLDYLQNKCKITTCYSIHAFEQQYCHLHNKCKECSNLRLNDSYYCKKHQPQNKCRKPHRFSRGNYI
jgi:hypothetical protein